MALRLRISSYDKEQSLDSLPNGNYVLERECFTVLYNQCDFRRGRVVFEYMVIPRDFFKWISLLR